MTRIWQQVGVGILPVDLITGAKGVTDRAVMTQDEARHGPVVEDRQWVADALGLTVDDINQDLPVQVFSTGLPGLIIPLNTLDATRRVTLNINRFNELCRSVSVTGAEVFTLETIDRAHHVHARNFDPLVGVFEDPAYWQCRRSLGGILACEWRF